MSHKSVPLYYPNIFAMNNYNQKYTSIKAWAEDDRPREKFILKGRSILSDAELIAIQLGSGSRNESALDLAKRILQSVSGSYSKLARLSIEELIEFKGVGVVKAINILSSLEIGRRRKVENNNNLSVIRSSKSIFEIFSDILRDLEYEEFWCLYLGTSNKVIKKEIISKGGIMATIVDVRLVIKRALLLSSTAIVLVHNHPSGEVKPSTPDINITKKIKNAAIFFDIDLLDHVIIGDNKYFSFSDENIL